METNKMLENIEQERQETILKAKFKLERQIFPQIMNVHIADLITIQNGEDIRTNTCYTHYLPIPKL